MYKPPPAGPEDAAPVWIDRVIERHAATMSRPEFLKAIRALSARYVEQRASLSRRSPLDSAGKRAAFAGFYAPLHYLTARAVVDALGLAATSPTVIVDLGCGTGVAGAAWALACPRPPSIVGVDSNAWVLAEARWNWAALSVSGQLRLGDLTAALARTRTAEAIVCGWSLNELDDHARGRAIGAILDRGARGAPTLVLEPLATRAVPWWTDFARRAAGVGARVDEWKLTQPLPPMLEALDEAAGFRRQSLNARSAAFGVS